MDFKEESMTSLASMPQVRLPKVFSVTFFERSH